ncbi:reverse transcriptase domain-containing protein [Tanacetum coccineum]
MEGRITFPRIQAPDSEGTPSTWREESQGHTNKAGEPEDTIQPPLIPSKENTQTDEKDEEKDESLEKSLGSKPPEKVVIHNDCPDKTITIKGNLSVECGSGLIEMIRRHVDAFAWTPTDMTRIRRVIAERELKTYPHIEPWVQRKRSIAPDRRKVVKDEVIEWLKAGIVRRIRYLTWVANPILVKKPDNSWWMCIDFKDLNKACSKDLYPLPEIDWKIESLMGFKYKCFLDAYKGYHQIQMAKKDEEKTAFHNDEGVFCYTKMPFRLKNAGATYQRSVDTIFEGQMGRNLEAYVDDMVIKSKTKPEMIKGVKETLLTLKKVNMNLNPKKCSFGMEEGKFLEYIVTFEGIRANPEKAKDVVNMPSPCNLKQMQRISGKLAALNRFLSKAAKKSLPCLDTLKNVQIRRISIGRQRMKKHSKQ